MGMKQHEEVGLTLVATPVLREAVSKLEDMMELAAADMLMEPKGTEYNSDLWLLIGKLRGSLHTPNAVSPEEMLCNELNKVIEAGDTLAEAAHCVQSSYDGIHRLRLALSGWYKTRANENGRANDRNCMECGNAIYQGVLCAECHSKASNRD